MPYIIHPKGIDCTIEWLESIISCREWLTTDAESAVSALGDIRMQRTRPKHDTIDPTTHAVTFLPSNAERDTWHNRETERFTDGTYQSVPWYQLSALRDLHYAHLSLDTPGMIAFTKTAEHGVQDRQTRMKPGRYLQEYYADRMTTDEIAKYVAQCSASHQTLQFATTMKDIRAVYAGGPESCMGGPLSHTNQYWHMSDLDGHCPTDVYAEPSDLAVAYVGPIDHVSQRAVVWPDKKRWIRIYGTGPLQVLLTRAGYTEGSLIGAKIARIDIGRGVLMPYIDGVDYANDYDRTRLELTSSGDYSTSSTDGVVEATDSEPTLCDRCEAEIDEGDTLCSSCEEAYWRCENCNAGSYNDIEYSDGDGSYCERCWERLSTLCRHGDCTAEWIESHEFTALERNTRQQHEINSYCRSCARDYVYCEPCDASYYEPDHESCPTCERSPRCEHTIDRLATDPTTTTPERLADDESPF